MTRLSIFLAISALACGQTAPGTRSVTFIVIGAYGHPLSGWRVTDFRDNHSDTTTLFHGLTATGLPAGSYRYQLEGTSPNPRCIPQLKGNADTFYGDALIVVVAHDDLLNCAAFDRALPRNLDIRGKIDPVPRAASEPTWVNIHPVFSGYSDTNVLVHSGGDFTIPTMLQGPYIISVIRAGQVLYSQPYSFDGYIASALLTLKLPGAPPTIHVKP